MDNIKLTPIHYIADTDQPQVYVACTGWSFISFKDKTGLPDKVFRLADESTLATHYKNVVTCEDCIETWAIAILHVDVDREYDPHTFYEHNMTSVFEAKGYFWAPGFRPSSVMVDGKKATRYSFWVKNEHIEKAMADLLNVPEVLMVSEYKEKLKYKQSELCSCSFSQFDHENNIRPLGNNKCNSCGKLLSK